MAEWSDQELTRHVADRLDRVGLTGPAFVATAVVDDLRERLALDRELDALLGPAAHETDADQPVPVDDGPFDPRRP